MTYVDTSAMVKLYYPEPESDQMSAWVKTQPHGLLYCRLHELELNNALSLKVFRGELEPNRRAEVTRTLIKDVHANILIQPVLNWDRVFTEAIRLAEAHTAGIGSRSLDLLHVAVAVVYGCPGFLTFDQRQQALATVAGLTIVELEP